MWRPARNLQRFSSNSLASQRRGLGGGGTQSNPYPYPEHPNPTPHQIFHLPYQASQDDIKTRYYDLVRIHHPDSPVVRALRLTPEVAHARFQSISTAYDTLRGKAQGIADDSETKFAAAAATAARRGAHTSRPDLHLGDERWKDRIIMGGLVLTLGLFIAQTASTRFQVLAAKKNKDVGSVKPIKE